ncbi:hypothetical protein K491DRAFT_571812, partial [Lophiostoma macrostomum CBS 122681]
IAGETIEIKIGKGDASETFHVHKTLVCTASKFFANATKPGWQNNETGKPKPIDLSDEEPAIFKVFVQWLYGRTIAISLLQLGVSIGLARAYVLGEMLIAEAFQDDVLKAMIART